MKGGVALSSGWFEFTQPCLKEKKRTQKQKPFNSLYQSSAAACCRLSLTCTRLLSHLSYSPEKWSLTQAVLALNPRGAVLKRHRSNVDRNTFIGIVSPFKRRLGVALAATGRLGWLAGHLISISPALDSPAPGWLFRRSLTSLSRWRSDGGCFLFFKSLSTKLILANKSVSSS